MAVVAVAMAAGAAGSGEKHAGNTSTRRTLPVTLCPSGEEQSGNAALFSLALSHSPSHPTPPPKNPLRWNKLLLLSPVKMQPMLRFYGGR